MFDKASEGSQLIGRLALSFEPAGLRVKMQEPPWRVVRGFRTPSGETLAHVHNVSGGILDTDHLHWEVDVKPGVLAQLTSTGATRIHRSRSEGRISRQDARIHVAAAGYFEYLPDQLIPFAGSRFQQSARVELEPGASLIWWDRITPGREASGEVFRFESLGSSFELIAASEPVAIERWTIRPLRERLDSPAKLGSFRHFGSCYVCRAGEPSSYWRAMEADLQSITDGLSTNETLWSVSSLRAHGLVVRAVALNGRPLVDGLVEIWRAAKLRLCGREAILPRKVP